MMPGDVPYSVLVLTLNEEVNLPGCLDSVSHCDDVVVFDSHSSDKTEAIALERGCRVFKRTFDNYAAQRNAALALDFKHDWILMLDADERITPELDAEIHKRLTGNATAGVTLYRLRRRDMFFGRWIKRSSGYPTWFGRLLKKGDVTVQREINEEYYTEGDIGLLDGHLIHYPFNKGVSYWIERHNRYSTMEAKALFEERSKNYRFLDIFLAKDPMLRRKAFKQLAYRMPPPPPPPLPSPSFTCIFSGSACSMVIQACALLFCAVPMNFSST